MSTGTPESQNTNLDDVSFDEWEFGITEDIMRPLLEQAAKCVVEVMLDSESENAPRLQFPIEWYIEGISKGDHESDALIEGVPDPLRVRVNFPAVSKKGDTGAFIDFNLRDSLAYGMRGAADDGSFGEGLTLLSAALRQLADEIDAAVKEGSDDAD